MMKLWILPTRKLFGGCSLLFFGVSGGSVSKDYFPNDSNSFGKLL